MDYLHIKKQIVKIILKFLHDIICHFDKFNHSNSETAGYT